MAKEFRMFEFDCLEVLSLACSAFVALWGFYTFLLAMPERAQTFLFFVPLVAMYTAYEKIIALFEKKEEEEWEWAISVDEEEEKLNQAYEDFKSLCRLEKDVVFSDEEGFLNTEVLEAFDLTGVEYGVLLTKEDVFPPSCCDKLICECAWKSKQ